MKAVALALAVLLGACGEVVYTGLDESGRPIPTAPPATTASTAQAPGGPAADSADSVDESTLDDLADLADAIGRLASAGRNTDGEAGFIACTDANRLVADLEDASLPASVTETVEAAATVAAVCHTSNSLRTYRDLADAAGEAAAALRGALRGVRDG